MGSIKGLAGNTVWYGLSSIVARFFTYLLVPLYTTVFLPGEYGIVTELYSFTAFLYPIFTYGMETAYFRFSTKNKDSEPTNFNRVVSAIICSTVVLSGLLIWFGQDISMALDYPEKEILFYWMASILGVDALTAIPFARLRLHNKAKKFALLKFFNIMFSVFLNLFFLIFCLKVYLGEWFPSMQPFMRAYYDVNFKVKYIFLSNLISNSLLLPLLFKEFKGFRFQLDFKKLKPILIYGAPLLFMGLAGVTSEMLSRVLLKYWLPLGFYPGQTSMDALGIFGACYKLSIFMVLSIQAFRYAAEPFFFSSAGGEKSPQLFADIMTGFVIFNALIFVGISVNLDWIGLFLRDPAYREGLVVVPVLLLAYLFNGIYYNLSIWYKIKDKTSYGATITILGALLTIVLNFVLIPILGYFGSALVTLLTFVVMVVISFFLGQKHYPIPYQTGKILGYIILSTLLVTGFYPLSIDGLMLNILVKNMAVLLFGIVVYILEREHISGRMIFGFRIP